MTTTYKVVFTGTLEENVTENQALHGMVSSFGLNEKQAGVLLNAKRSVVVKKGITMDQGKALGLRLTKLGLNNTLLKEEAAKKTVATAKKPADKTVPPPSPPPEPEKKGLPGRSSVENFTPSQEASATTCQEKMQRSVPEQVVALNGYRWLAYAFQMFIEYPFPWIGLSLTMYILFGLLCFIPVAGPLICALILPLFLGTLMLGARKQESGGALYFHHFFTGFPINILQFTLLGILTVIGLIVCTLPVLAPALTGIFFSDGVNAKAAAAGSQNIFLGRVLLSMTLTVIFSMSMWFAPTLVAMESHSALSAIKISLQAAGKNIWALLVFSISIMAICIALIFVADIIIPLLVADGFQVSNLFLGLPLLIMTLLAIPSTAVIVLSMYTSYQNIFDR